MEILLSKNLVHIIDDKGKDSGIIEYIIDSVEELDKSWNEGLNQGYSDIELLSSLYELFNDEMKNVKNVSCKKGCSFCCNINVDCSSVEVDLIISEVALTKKDIEYMRIQSEMDLMVRCLSVEFSRCHFLINGECSIYENRPISFRKYFVVNPPNECDTKSDSKGTSVLPNLKMEVMASFISSKFGIGENMEKQIIDKIKIN